MDVARGWIGRSLLDGHGQTAGRITDIYMDQDSGQAEWALADTDRNEARLTFVPLLDATPEGDAVRVPYPRAIIDTAPSVDPDQELSQAAEEQLYGHYGLAYSRAESNSGLPAGVTVGTGTEPVAEGAGQQAGPEPATNGPGRPGPGPRLRQYVPVPPASTSAGEPTAVPDAVPATSTVVDDDPQPGTTPSADGGAPQTAPPAKVAAVLRRTWLLPVAGGLLTAVALLVRRRGRRKGASGSSRLATLARVRSRR
jgi:hypothetical protein